MIAKRNIMINKACGHSGKDTKVYRLSLPADMVRLLGITEDDRGVILKTYGRTITIEKD